VRGGRRGGVGVGDERAETERVDGAGLDPQPVAARIGPDHVRPDRPSQPRHERLQRVGRLGRGVAPQVVDQRGRAHRAARVEREAGQQPALAHAAERHRAPRGAVRPRLDGAEQPDPHPVIIFSITRAE
jgi:hypothetical protein